MTMGCTDMRRASRPAHPLASGELLECLFVFRLAAETLPAVVLLALVFSEKKEKETELLGVVGTPHVKDAHSHENAASTMMLHKAGIIRGNPETQRPEALHTASKARAYIPIGA